MTCKLEQLSQLFDEPVMRLSVPGMEDGWQCITVTFATGDSVTAKSRSIEAAWGLIFEAAFERTASADQTNQPEEM